MNCLATTGRGALFVETSSSLYLWHPVYNMASNWFQFSPLLAICLSCCDLDRPDLRVTGELQGCRSGWEPLLRLYLCRSRRHYVPLKKSVASVEVEPVACVGVANL